MPRSKTSSSHGIFSHEMTIPVILSFFQLVLLMTFHVNYDYFRDELYYIACSNHLAFGYVDQPPLSIAILWITRLLLGDSLNAIRFLPALVGSIVVLLAALMTRKLGGLKFAQGLAALSVVAAHGLIGHGRTFSMNPFDLLFWTLAGYILIVILMEEKSKLWILFGFVVGLGLLNKYSIGFLIIGLVAGLLFTKHRRQFYSKWFWLGGVVAFVVFLPHIIWQINHDFPSLEFMRNASQNKNVSLSVIDFLVGQLRDMNIINAFLWIGGIYFFYTYQGGRFRPLAWMYPVVFFVMIAGNAKVYYLSAIYPIFLAGGAILFAQYIQKKFSKWLGPIYVGLLSIVTLVILPFTVPVLPVERFIQYEYTLGLTPHAEEIASVGELPQYYADQFGWREMVDTVASVYKRLTQGEQSQCVIYVRNYGEAAAIDFFGIQQGLPNARCAHNSYWLWGPGNRTGDIAIIFGDSRNLEENLSDLRSRYKYVEFAATTNAKYTMPYENGRMIFICKGMNTTLQILWPGERFYI